MYTYSNQPALHNSVLSGGARLEFRPTDQSGKELAGRWARMPRFELPTTNDGEGIYIHGEPFNDELQRRMFGAPSEEIHFRQTAEPRGSATPQRMPTQEHPFLRKATHGFVGKHVLWPPQNRAQARRARGFAVSFHAPRCSYPNSSPMMQDRSSLKL